MAESKESKPKKPANSRLRVVTGPHLNAVITAANELKVTNKEYLDLKSTPSGYVLVYYR